MLCGCVEQFGDGTPALKLPTNRPYYLVRDRLPNHSQDEIAKWAEEWFVRWGSVCDFASKGRIDKIEDAGSGIVLLITAADLGGSGVLADQQLPYTGARVLVMRLNVRINWTLTDRAMPRGKIDAYRTGTHEMGHFQGHVHWPVGAPAELMEPTISDTILGPQPTEGAMSAKWFGLPKPENTPPPAPGSAAWDFKVSKTGDVQIFRDGVRQRVSPSPFTG